MGRKGLPGAAQSGGGKQPAVPGPGNWNDLLVLPEMEHDFDEEAAKVFAWLNLQPAGTSRYNALGEESGGRVCTRACGPSVCGPAGLWGDIPGGEREKTAL